MRAAPVSARLLDRVVVPALALAAVALLFVLALKPGAPGSIGRVVVQVPSLVSPIVVSAVGLGEDDHTPRSSAAPAHRPVAAPRATEERAPKTDDGRGLAPRVTHEAQGRLRVSRGGATTPTGAPPKPSPARPGSVLVPVVDPSCTLCGLVQGTDGTIEATADPSRSRSDTAYALLDFGGAGGLAGAVTVHDLISLPPRQKLSSDLQILQLLDVRSRVLYGLYISAADRTLHFSSPPGGLRAQPIDFDTGAVVPDDGSGGLAVTIAAQPNANVSLDVNGARAASFTDLVGAGTGKPRFLAAGIIAASAPVSGGAVQSPVTVRHADVAVTRDGTQPLVPGSQAATPPPLATPVTPAQRSPASTDPPALSGRAAVHETLSATPGVWSDPDAAVTVVWERCAATGDSCQSTGVGGPAYTVVSADVGSVLRVRATAQNGAGSSVAFSAPTSVVKAPPALVGGPSISGDPVEGGTLTADPGAWSDADLGLAYAWQRCDGSGANCVPIAGQTGATLTLGAADIGSTIAIAITASGSGGQTTVSSSVTQPVIPAPVPTLPPVAPANVTAPTISGDVLVGHTLTADAGLWDDPAASFSFVWSRCAPDGACTPIDGATGSTYTLTQDDLGATIVLTVTATSNGLSTTATSSPTQTVGQEPPPVEPPAPPTPPDDSPPAEPPTDNPPPQTPPSDVPPVPPPDAAPPDASPQTPSQAPDGTPTDDDGPEGDSGD